MNIRQTLSLIAILAISHSCGGATSESCHEEKDRTERKYTIVKKSWMEKELTLQISAKDISYSGEVSGYASCSSRKVGEEDVSNKAISMDLIFCHGGQLEVQSATTGMGFISRTYDVKENTPIMAMIREKGSKTCGSFVKIPGDAAFSDSQYADFSNSCVLEMKSAGHCPDSLP